MGERSLLIDYETRNTKLIRFSYKINLIFEEAYRLFRYLKYQISNHHLFLFYT